MKVLQINSVCGIRSTGRICTNIAETLLKEGHECKIAYGRESVPDKYKNFAVRIGNNLDANCHAISTRIFDNTGFASKKATKKFIKWIKEYDPDIIHLHNIHGYYINIKLLFDYIRSSGKPVVWTLHDCWPFTGHCAYFDSIECEKWQTECKNCPQKKEYPTSLIFDRSKENFALKKQLFNSINNLTIITPSEWLAALVGKSFLMGKKIEVINNGIDLDVFKPSPSDFRKKHGLENKKIVLGVASAWGNRKGLYDFYKLAGILGDDYKIVLVGLKSEQKKELPPQILGITSTDSTQELAQIYSAADVFVNPTYSDNYPTVNLEALVCGTPVIGYDTGGSSESIVMGGGVLVERGRVELLADAIINNIGKLNIADMFDKESCGLHAMVQKYLEIYKKYC